MPYGAQDPMYPGQDPYSSRSNGQNQTAFTHSGHLQGQPTYQQGNDTAYGQAHILQNENPSPSYQTPQHQGPPAGYGSQNQSQLHDQRRMQHPGQPLVYPQQQQQRHGLHGQPPPPSYGFQPLVQNQVSAVGPFRQPSGNQQSSYHQASSPQVSYVHAERTLLPPQPGQHFRSQAPIQQSPALANSVLPGLPQATFIQEQPSRPQQNQSMPSSTSKSHLSTEGQASHPQKTKQPRTVSHVQIPAHQTSSTIPKQRAEVPRPPKRRKSNDGLICETSTSQQEPSIRKPTLQSLAASSPLTELASSQLVVPSPFPQQAIDLQAVLLSLSDEYINAAQALSGLVASGAATKEQTNRCHELLATGMGCLYAILNNYRQTDARKEARIRLQLASLLLEETENDVECAEVLSKGIALCERSRLSDTKFAMHHIEVRLLFKTKPKAALKNIDHLVGEAAEMKLIHWIYAFRFLRVSLGLQMATATDVLRQLENTSAILALADQRSDVAVQIMAACLETVVHLQSGTTEAVESAQRSLTAARTHQLRFEMKQLPQLAILMDCLALACNLVHFSPAQIDTSLQQMQSSMDKSKEGKWTIDGAFFVPLGGSTNLDIELDTAGIIKSMDEQAALQFSWFTRGQVMAVGYLLSGLARMYNNHIDKKGEAFLKEGMKMHRPRESVPLSLAASRAGMEWQAFMNINTYLLLMFAQCDRSDWELALRNLRELKDDMAETFAGVTFDRGSLLLLKYLEAVIHHGLGELNTASDLYGASELHFDPTQKQISIFRDCQALASLSHIQILRSRFTPQQESSTQQMLDALEPYCRSHPNKSMQAAYHILRSTSSPLNQNTSILKRKQFLESAVRTAQSMKNNQILCMVLNLMREAFFNNIVGNQAEQNGRAARTLAKRTNSPLWLATAAGMYSQTLELCASHDQAAEVRAEGEAKAAALPANVKKLLNLHS
nr:hypothetical protein CFP56_44286 [Quercus suber]